MYSLKICGNDLKCQQDKSCHIQGNGNGKILQSYVFDDNVLLTKLLDMIRCV